MEICGKKNGIYWYFLPKIAWRIQYGLTLGFPTEKTSESENLRVFWIRVAKNVQGFPNQSRKIRVRKSESEKLSRKSESEKSYSQSFTVSFCQAGKHQRTRREWWSLRGRPLAKCVHFSCSLPPAAGQRPRNPTWEGNFTQPGKVNKKGREKKRLGISRGGNITVHTPIFRDIWALGGWRSNPK